MSEWVVRMPAEIPGGTVEIELVNDGEFPHELVIVRAESYDDLPQLGNGSVVEDELEPGSLVLRIPREDPGASATAVIDLEPGEYVFMCNITIGPNSHAGNGQTKDVTVTA